jgi:hypothetical protein
MSAFSEANFHIIFTLNFWFLCIVQRGFVKRMALILKQKNWNRQIFTIGSTRSRIFLFILSYMVSLLPNLAKSSYGWSAIWLHNKIGSKKAPECFLKKKIIQTNHFVCM